MNKTMKTFVLEFGQDRIEVTIDSEGGGAIASNLKEGCSKPEESCVGCAAIDGLESLVLAHACAGIDITTPEYKEGVHAALEAIGNNCC